MNGTIDWDQLSEVEKIKYESNYLHGTLVESLDDPISGAIAASDRQVSKFHGIYQQWDRDLDKERKSQKLEPAFSFLIRVRMPGGVVTPKQWLQMDSLSDEYANGTLKITTRQTFQLHGVIKKNLKTTIRKINDSLLDTISACGDVNRNVMCHANPAESPLYPEIIDLAKESRQAIFCQNQKRTTKSGSIKNLLPTAKKTRWNHFMETSICRVNSKLQL